MFDVVIIGGGLSGLAASVKLVAKGARILLLEKAPRLGGRCYSFVDNKTDDVVDNGQHILLGAYHNLIEYLDIIGTKYLLKKTSLLSLPIYDPNRGRGVFQVSNLPKPLNLTSAMLKFKLLSFKERKKLLKVGSELKGWNNKLESKLSSMAIEDWLNSLDQSAEVKKLFWYPIAISIMNEKPESASALLFARALRTAFLGKKSDSSILIPIVGQTQLYSDAAAELLDKRKSKILLNTAVDSIEITGDRIISIKLRDGEKVTANYYISSLPPQQLQRILPSKLKTIKPFDTLGRYISAPIISFHLWFDKNFMDVDFIGLANCNLQWLFDRRKFIKSDKRTGFISAVISGAHDYVNLTKEKLLSLALHDIYKVYPESRKTKLIHSIIIKEKRATFSATNDVEKIRPSTQTPLLNFYIAGDWTNTGLPATIESAVISGFKAAELIPV